MRKLLLAGVACVLIAGASRTLAAPNIDISPRGLQSGGTTTLTVTGSGLSAQAQLMSTLPIAKQAVRTGAQPGGLQIDVTLDAGVPAGIYQLRIVTDEGVSNAVALGVDHLQQLPFAAETKTLPAALHGSVTGGTIAETTFAAQAGQRITVDLEARRLGAALNPVLEIHRPDGVLLAYSPGQRVMGGDARLDVKLPQNGKYRVRLHDALYRGASPGFFRLKIGQLGYADIVYPLGAQRGQAASVEFAETPLGAASRATLAPQTPLDVMPAPWPAAGFTGSRPTVFVGDMPEVAEVEGKPAEAAAPAGFTGRLAKPGEVDRFLLRVKPGMRLRFNVLAERIGSPLDAVLTVQRQDGGALAASDDQPDTIDPSLDFTVPGGVEAVALVLSDQLRGGGPRHVYRITAREITPDFRLVTLADRVNVPRGGAAVLRVRATRLGYSGPIKLSFPGGLPTGVAVASGDAIPAGATDSLLTLRAEANAGGTVLSNLLGEGTAGNITVRRFATVTDNQVTRHQPWLKYELPLSVMKPDPIQLAWQPEAADALLITGTTLSASAKLTRTPAAMGSVRLSLLTSQIPPLVKDEKNKKGEPDVTRTLRLETQPTIPTGQDTSVLKIIVPPNLPSGEYDLTVQAELLNGQQVVATAVSPSRRLRAAPSSFSLELVSPPNVEVRLGKSPAAKLAGRIRRLGFPHPVTLTLAGLPKEVPAPSVVVPGDKTDFELAIMFPATVKPGDLKGVKLIGMSQLGPKNVAKAANEVPLELKILPTEK